MTSRRATAHQYSPRERMVYQAAQLIRRGGVSGTSLRDVVAAADAPWGSVQHYFPRGKDQLVDEALGWAGEFAADRVQQYMTTTKRPTPSGLFAWMTNQWREDFTSRGYECGCPLVAATADVAASNETLRESVRRGFDTWLRPIAGALRAMGVPRAKAQSLAVLMLSSLEGAIAIARARHDLAPLTVVLRELGPVLDASAT
jgi:AcrR family transcriptional regulator